MRVNLDLTDPVGGERDACSTMAALHDKEVGWIIENDCQMWRAKVVYTRLYSTLMQSFPAVLDLMIIFL